MTSPNVICFLERSTYSRRDRFLADIKVTRGFYLSALDKFSEAFFKYPNAQHGPVYFPEQVETWFIRTHRQEPLLYDRGSEVSRAHDETQLRLGFEVR